MQLIAFFFTFIYIPTFVSPLFAQELLYKVDSLKQELSSATHDTSRANIMNNLSWELQNSLPDSALYYAQQALALAEKINYKKGMADSYNNIGNIHLNQGNYPLALEYYQKNLKIYEELGDKKGIAASYNNIGNIHYYQGNYSLTLEYYQKSLRIEEELADKKGMARSYNNIGLIHSNQGNYPFALEYYQKSLKIREEVGDKKGMASSYSNIGSIHHYQGNYSLALEYDQKSLKILEELGDKKGMALPYNNIGNIHHYQGNYPLAMKYYQKSLKIREELGDKKGMAESYNSIGVIHSDQGNYPLSLKYYQKSLKISEELGDKKGMGRSYNNIGVIHYYQGNYPLALEYYQKSLKAREELGDKKGMALSYGNMGVIYTVYDTTKGSKAGEMHYTKAIDYFTKALAIQEEIGDKWGSTYSNTGIGNLYLRHKREHEALPYFEAAIKTATEIGALKEQSAGYERISMCYAQTGKYESAYHFLALHKVLHDSLFNDSVSTRLVRLEALYENEKKDNAIKQLLAANLLKDAKLQKQWIIIWAVSGGMLLMVLGGMIIMRMLRQKQKANKELEKLSIVASETENAVIIMDQDSNFEWANKAFTRLWGYTLEEFKEVNGNSLILASANPDIMIAIKECIKNKIPVKYESVNKRKDGSTFWVQSTLTPALDNDGNVKKLVLVDSDISALKAVEQELREKNKDITDSINYAEKIQQAIYPPLEEIYRTFADSFVLFKPLATVSGDFYYIALLKNMVVIAVGDCTGHGVPGAFMSMIGNDLLNQLIKEKGYTDPGVILKELHKGIQSALHQEKAGAKVNDGLDIALLVIEKNSGTDGMNCWFAGAHNSLYLFRADKAEMEIYKADKFGIGGMQSVKEPVFTTYTIKLYSGDSFYISSDGIIDQFGGPHNKRFMSHRFRELLTGIKDKSMREQQRLLEKALSDWRGSNPQTDDITVMGVRV